MRDTIIFAIVGIVLIIALLLAIGWELHRPDTAETEETPIEVPETTVVIEPTKIITHVEYIDETEYAEPSIEQTAEQIDFGSVFFIAFCHWSGLVLG